MFANSHIKQIRKVNRRLNKLEIAFTSLSNSGTGTDLEFDSVHYPVNTLTDAIGDLSGRIENAVERGRNVDPRHVEVMWDTLRTLEYVVRGMNRFQGGAGPPSQSSSLQKVNFALSTLRKAISNLSLPENKFKVELARILSDYDITAHGIASLAGMDPSYAYKLLNGQRVNPGREVVRAVGDGLVSEFKSSRAKRDAEKLMKAAGHDIRPRRRSKSRWPRRWFNRR